MYKKISDENEKFHKEMEEENQSREEDIQVGIGVATGLYYKTLPAFVLRPPRNLKSNGNKFFKHGEAIRSELKILSNWVMKRSKLRSGIRFIDPTNDGNNVRVMPGDKSSKYENYQNPYVVRY